MPIVISSDRKSFLLHRCRHEFLRHIAPLTRCRPYLSTQHSAENCTFTRGLLRRNKPVLLMPVKNQPVIPLLGRAQLNEWDCTTLLLWLGTIHFRFILLQYKTKLNVVIDLLACWGHVGGGASNRPLFVRNFRPEEVF